MKIKTSAQILRKIERVDRVQRLTIWPAVRGRCVARLTMLELQLDAAIRFERVRGYGKTVVELGAFASVE